MKVKISSLFDKIDSFLVSREASVKDSMAYDSLAEALERPLLLVRVRLDRITGGGELRTSGERGSYLH